MIQQMLGKDKIYIALGLVIICGISMVLDVEFAKELCLMTVPGLLAIIRD